MNREHATVSFDDEPLILVNEADEEIGFASKARCHQGEGTLHRAFSVFLFNAAGEVLLQQRSAAKLLWPLSWSNACCSHPRRGENMEQAVARRLREELAVSVPARFLFKFRYRARFADIGSEHELCYVYAGRAALPQEVNANEIAAMRAMAPAALDTELAAHGDFYTPWLKLEWQRLRGEHWDAVAAIVAASGTE